MAGFRSTQPTLSTISVLKPNALALGYRTALLN